MNIFELFKNITTFVFDVDGVLTEGNLIVLPDGLMARRMNIKDGYALQLAVKRGYNVIVISGGTSPEVKERLNKLGVANVWMQVNDKKNVLQNFIRENNLQQTEILFMGDDIPDYEAMNFVGLPCCPSDAAVEIKEISKYISPLPGGVGCAREVIEKVMKLRGDWKLDTHVKSQ
jgi:3-deoxy-D-manno-octulosonate 8-phosphate phosphatase (KDO 8-P phosphatase)